MEIHLLAEPLHSHGPTDVLHIYCSSANQKAITLPAQRLQVHHTMPDVPTALIAAGAKPLTKWLLTFRPGKLLEKASSAEREVTNILYSDTVLLPDDDFEQLAQERKKVDLFTYRYYNSANKLRRLAYHLTDPAKQLHGQEGQRLAAMRGRGLSTAVAEASSVPVRGRLASYTLKDVRLLPGNNVISIPCPSNVAEMATIEVRLQPTGRTATADDTASISISFTTSSASDGSMSNLEDDSGEPSENMEDVCTGAMTIELSSDKGKARGPGASSSRAAFDTTIEIDVTDIPDGWRIDF
ncbi:hypothetical protein NUW54_g4445 [Trametes sanguinea]|uniref:Uncharacterized protein n=1 Tax=Trametes sanguinea TaxID=158606 RepID=A0ACC1PY17_9APHY|nr:hypothetical protein NUW54_g4445 [Trametes sanguinea]